MALFAVYVAASAARSRPPRSPEEELLERRLDLALDAGGMTTWMWDARSGSVSWDARGDAVYGGAAPTTVDVWIERAHHDDRAEMRAVLARSIGDRVPFQVVHRTTSADGVVRWLELRGEPVLDQHGELLGTAGVAIDVTEGRRAALELAESREALEQILDVTPALAGADRPDDVAARVCQAAVDVFGCDACGIWSVERDVVRPVAHHPVELDRAPAALRLDEVPGFREELERPAPAYVERGGPADAAVAHLAGLSMRSGVLVPLGGAADAALHLFLWWTGDQGPPGLGRLAVMRRFADQVALALEQARTRLARDEVDALSTSLQAGLLPAVVVRAPDVRVNARSRPGEDRILLGGDFYDVLERPDGELAFVVGDVTGHGPQAAAVGAALRAAWRALVVAGDDAGPGGWLHGLGATFASYETGPEMLVTVFTGLISRDRTTATVANAGHPAPMLLAGGADPLDVPSGIALGVTAPGEHVATTRVELDAPWRLLLYTDGVIEVRTGRRPSSRLEQEGLSEWLRAHAGALDDASLLDALLDHLGRINVDPLPDDISVVLLGGGGDPPARSA